MLMFHTQTQESNRTPYSDEIGSDNNRTYIGTHVSNPSAIERIEKASHQRPVLSNRRSKPTRQVSILREYTN